MTPREGKRETARVLHFPMQRDHNTCAHCLNPALGEGRRIFTLSHWQGEERDVLLCKACADELLRVSLICWGYLGEYVLAEPRKFYASGMVNTIAENVRQGLVAAPLSPPVALSAQAQGRENGSEPTI